MTKRLFKKTMLFFFLWIIALILSTLLLASLVYAMQTYPIAAGVGIISIILLIVLYLAYDNAKQSVWEEWLREREHKKHE
jgi:hypothetical protein